MTIHIIGAGLAGCEAAWQLTRRGIPVVLHEMRPGKSDPAHHTALFSELVCSNSLRANNIENAVGLLKEEMRQLDSLIIREADAHQVPAGGALAVDREGFAQGVTSAIRENPLVTLVEEEVTDYSRFAPEDYVITASGPLTSGALSEAIQKLVRKDYFHFFDAAAPIVTVDSLDQSKVYKASRYDKGEAAYYNCPFNQEEYLRFWQELCHAETAPVKDFEHNVFEACMPIEEMALRGEDTMRFGPLKPVGLPDPRTGKDPYAVVQLRQDNGAGTLYNIVGFQTHLKWPEQRRVFRMIPGLENAEFVRYGVMHKNSYLNSPLLLDADYSLRTNPHFYFAGQMTGVEGYVESAASGLAAGIYVARALAGKPRVVFPKETAMGALSHYISNPEVRHFQPMNINFGLIAPWDGPRIRGKKEKNGAIARRSLKVLENVKKNLHD
ncbi:methylenetetrahydrofolate--tRNA-(uracil(54)-C(5))-methyltransferase (FADH(2)-oxidizing) TrmFO [Acidaminococcus timonensis]|uniref:methylenetetrahydrofolate--tRNA-(uracil(54)- C(5))-methyltransferase (FADH(2)-oxidizing) TrmFO n=1 Tax=Acidaminococcus timonensis TaxID=1871002 RepID=UPI002941F59D|nr:methylenetetrahydrofolate--tRNA-(uracil(54)-C(5))-methyltransferase (FADH(2)-oxidizing) TrmFO [Acidaminococcus timonensis]